MPVPLLRLYELRAYDEASPAWSPLYFREVITGDAAAAPVGNAQSPPADKAWFITGTYMSLSPQAALFALNAEIRVNPVTGASLTVLHADKWPTGQLAAGETVSFTQFHDVVIIGGVQSLNAIWQFSAGNIANSMQWGFHGYEVPRANVVLR